MSKNAEEKAKLLGLASVLLLLLGYGGHYIYKEYSNKKELLKQAEMLEQKEDKNIESTSSIDTGQEFGNISTNVSSTGQSGKEGFNTSDVVREDMVGFNNNYELISLSDDQLEVYKLRDAQLKEKRKKWKLSGPQRTLKFNKRYNEEFVSINTSLYQIVQRYFSKQTFADTKYSKYADPLYIMAVSNVEFGGATDPEILLAPAIPTNKGIKVTKDNILTFGYSNYLNYPEVLEMDRDTYRGPLQMYVTGLTEAIRPSDLLSCEWVQLQNAEPSLAKSMEQSVPQYVEGSGATAHVDGMVLANKAGRYGDRWNYGDAVNRLSGFIHSNWIKYQNNTEANKDGDLEINSVYSWMAMSAIGHNASPGIYYLGDSIDIGGSYFWWPYGPYSNARKYCHYLGTDKCVSYIQEEAEKALKDYSRGKDLKFRLTRQEGYALAEEMKSKGYIPEGLWKNTCWNHEEKIAYPIQVLYNYFILEGIYSGK